MNNETWVVEWNAGCSWKRFSRYGDAIAFASNLFRWGYTDAVSY